MVQPSYDRLEIFLVPGEQFDKELVTKSLTESITNILPEIQCAFTVCSTIPHMPSGKTQPFVSYVSRAR